MDERRCENYAWDDMDETPLDRQIGDRLMVCIQNTGSMSFRLNCQANAVTFSNFCSMRLLKCLAIIRVDHIVGVSFDRIQPGI